MALSQRRGQIEHAGMGIIDDRRLHLRREIVEPVAIRDAADKADVVVELAHMFGERVGLQQNVRVLHQDRVIRRLREGRVEIVDLGAGGELRRRMQNTRRNVRMMRKDRAQMVKRGRACFLRRRCDIDLRIVLRKDGVLRRIESVFQHFDGQDDRHRRLLHVSRPPSGERRLRKGGDKRHHQQRDRNAPENRCELSDESADVAHALSPRSRVSTTSTVKRRITPSTIPAGRKENSRIAAYM